MEETVEHPGVFAKNPLFQPDYLQLGGASRPATRAGTADGGLLSRADDAEAAAYIWDRRHEEALAPLLQSIRSNQGDRVYTAFSSQMDKLYQVFRDLYDQDQMEIRRLLVTMEAQKQQLQQLAADNATVRQQLRREREQSAAAVSAAMAEAARSEAAAREAAAVAAAASAAAAPAAGGGGARDSAAGGPQGRKRMNESLRSEADSERGLPGSAFAKVQGQQPAHRSGGRGGGGAGGGGEVRERSGRESVNDSGGRSRADSPSAKQQQQKERRRPYIILFLPYMLHPAHHWWRFYAAWLNSWSTRRTTWLAVAWLLVFLLAVGLLVGLLVPWDNLSATSFTVGPYVADTTAGAASLVMALNKNAAVFYAVVPEAFTTGLPPPPPPPRPPSPPSQRKSRRRLYRADSDWPAAQLDWSGPSGPTRLMGSLLHRLLRHPPGGDVRWDPGAATATADPGPLGPLGSLLTGRWRHGRNLGRDARRALASSASDPLPPLHLGDVEADDIRDVVGARVDGAVLFPYAVACGLVEVAPKRRNYTLTVNGIALSGGSSSASEAGAATGAAAGTVTPKECLASFGMALNGSLPVSTGTFASRRCQRCPMLWPGTSYVMLLIGDGGRTTAVYKIPFTTKAAAAPAA